MTHDEWLAERDKSIGASEVATVLGRNEFDTPLGLWARKTGNAPPVEVTDRMRRGHLMEPVIDAEYCRETGRETHDPGDYTILRKPRWPFIHTTLDRTVMPCEGHDMPGPLEMKDVGYPMRHHWDGRVPIHVQIQLQVQMAVIGADWGSVAAIIGGGPVVWRDFLRDEKFIRAMLIKVEAFMVLVHTETPPEPTGADLDVLRVLYPKPSPGVEVPLPDDLLPYAERLELNKPKLAALKAAIDGDKAAIQKAIGKAESGRFSDGSGYKWKVEPRKAHHQKASEPRVLRRLKA